MAHDGDLKQKKHASLNRYNTVDIIITSLPSPHYPIPMAQSQQRAKIIVGFPGIGKSFMSKDTSNQYSG